MTSFVLHLSFTSHINEARGLKIGMHNSYIDGSKVTNQIFDTLPRSCDFEVQSFVFTSEIFLCRQVAKED